MLLYINIFNFLLIIIEYIKFILYSIINYYHCMIMYLLYSLVKYYSNRLNAHQCM